MIVVDGGDGDRGITPYLVDVAVIDDGGSILCGDWEAGGGRPGAEGAVGVDRGIVSHSTYNVQLVRSRMTN